MIAEIVNNDIFTLFHKDFTFTNLAQSIRENVHQKVAVELTVYDTQSILDDHSA